MPLAEHDLIIIAARPAMGVSIHVPLAEHDRPDPGGVCFSESFNSRAPRGARRDVCTVSWPFNEFQFTCPSRSTTNSSCLASFALLFQFTCPSRSTTYRCLLEVCSLLWFQFTCPSRSTTSDFPVPAAILEFQFTCPSRSTTPGYPP